MPDKRLTGKEESLLVKDLSKGNLLAFNSLFHEYSKRLYFFALGYLKSEDEAEELVQEVFTIIWEKRADLKPELSFKSYLFTISFNLIKKHFRTKSYLMEYLKSKDLNVEDLNTIEEISHNSLYEFITKLVDQLPEKRRLIFIKSRFQGMSVKEISEQLGISNKTVENQLTDALKFMRTNLKKDYLLLFIIVSLLFT